MKQYVAEGIGTFLLVFIGTLSASLSGGSIFLVALTFGVLLAILVLLIGPISGAHVNPAVSLGAWLRGDLSSHDVLPFVLSQCIGAIGGSVLLFLLVGAGEPLGETMLPAETLLTPVNAFLLEAFLTFVFVSAVLMMKGVSERKAAAILGVLFFALHVIAIPLTGASFNPARALAPVVVGADPVAASLLWIFVAGPFLGGMVAGVVARR